jgi:hypothetical protein
MGWPGSAVTGAGAVDAMDVWVEADAPSLDALLLEVLEVVLALPGDVAAGRSSNVLISTLAIALATQPAHVKALSTTPATG